MVKMMYKKYFPELPFFLLSSVFFLDIGVLFGALNAFRVAGTFKVIEIHMTHWTSTLLGAVTLLMLGQIFFFLSYINEEKSPFHIGTLVSFFLWVVGIFFNYSAAWFKNGTILGMEFHFIAFIAFFSSIIFYFILCLSFVGRPIFRERLKEFNYVPIFWITGVAWLVLSVYFFQRSDTKFPGTIVNSLFLHSYLFGFFMFTLFGSLFFAIPWLFEGKQPTTATVLLDYILFLLGATVVVSQEYLKQEFFDIWFLSFVGPGIYVLAFLVFFLWLADFIYQKGINLSIGGLLVAIIMFAFFLTDTVMASVFPIWVPFKHVHLMFLGVLLLTTISIGSQILLKQYAGTVIGSTEGKWNFKEIFSESKLQSLSLILVIASVVMIILLFTLISLDWFPVADIYNLIGIFGIVLLISLLVTEFYIGRTLLQEKNVG